MEHAYKDRLIFSHTVQGQQNAGSGENGKKIDIAPIPIILNKNIENAKIQVGQMALLYAMATG